MEINEVATLKVRELAAAADRKGSAGERGERGQSQVKFITPLSLDRNDVSLPSHGWNNGWQPLKNIFTNGWLTEKPSKNNWYQWLSRYHSINGNGHLKNH